MPVERFARVINVPPLTHWRGDLRGGIQAAAVALPMGLAFGVASGLGPIAGIWSAICTGLFAGLFGGTPTQISGPTGPIAIVMASLLVTFSAQPAAVFGIIVLAGALQVVFGALRFGRYISLLPYPVVSGFATAVGCIIIVMQLNALLGHPPVSDTVAAVRGLPESIATANPTTVAIALASLLACRFMPRKIRTVVPAHLSVLVVGSALAALLGLDVPRLSAPESLLPSPAWPPFAELPWSQMWLAALVLALISSLDSLLTSVAADAATQNFHDSDRELVGQGLGNLCAGFLGVLPGAGSTFRTMANIRAGGRSPLSTVAHAGVLLLLLFGFGGLIRHIPASVLAGILIYIGLGIVDWRYIRRFASVPRGGVAIMLTVWLVGLFVNIVTGAVLGLVMASLAFVKRMADLQLGAIELSEAASKARGLDPAESEALDRSEGKTLLINLGGPLTFGAANGLSKRLANIARFRAIVLDFTHVPHIDESGIIALDNVIRIARDHDQTVLLVGLTPPVVGPILRFGLSEALKQCPRFEHRIDALDEAARICIQQDGT